MNHHRHVSFRPIQQVFRQNTGPVHRPTDAYANADVVSVADIVISDEDADEYIEDVGDEDYADAGEDDEDTFIGPDSLHRHDARTEAVPSAAAPKSEFNIDQVTLECMMNKNLYKKYLARTDVDRYEESRVQSRRLASVRTHIIDMTQQLINDYVRYGNSKQYTHKIHSAFETYIDLCMTHVAEYPPGSENDDIDVLFDPRKMK